MALRRKSFRSIIKVVRLYFREIDLVLFATIVAVSFFSLINLSEDKWDALENRQFWLF